MMTRKKFSITILSLLFCVLLNCVSPNAIPIKTEIQGIRTDVEAETINYDGAGWVVIGTSVISLIFVGAGLLLVRAFTKRGRSLTMLTGAIQEASPETIADIKRQLRSSKQQDREDLRLFCEKVGTFVKRK